MTLRSRVPAAVLAVGVLVGSACGSNTATGPVAAPGTTPTSGPAGAVAPARLVGPDEFARRVEDPRVVTINVHIPNEGDIAGTDLDVAFDQINKATTLPAELATPLAVYCRSGNMSAKAVRDLTARGYTDIVELDGGYDAWIRSGRPLQARAAGPPQ